MTEVKRFDTAETSRLRSELWRAQDAVRRLTKELAVAEDVRMYELEARYPEACYPCGRSHACRSCSPNRVLPGSGCLNCRQTGCDQTPCIPCRDVIEARGKV